MNRKEEINQHDAIHPIILWILASILFHFLLTVGLITLKFKKIAIPDSINKQNNETYILMDDSKQQMMPKPIPSQQPTPKQPSQQSQPIPEPKQQRHWSDYTLVPGRKGVDEQKIDDPTDLQNLPTPQNQGQKTKSSTTAKTNTSKSTDQKLDVSDQPPSEPKSTMHHQIENKTINESSSKTLNTKENQSSAQPKNRIPIQNQNPYDFVPKSSRSISFKDLGLGFDNQYQTIGNNANLIQAGKTFETPDPMALKHLTYYNQCAEMMKTEIAIHHQARLCPYRSGSRFTFKITVDRNGRLLNFRAIQSSGSQILDKVLSESVQSVKLFPPVPKFIIEDPFIMTWTFLH